MNQNKLISKEEEYNEIKISLFFYNKIIHEKSKDIIDNLKKYKTNKKVSLLYLDSNEQMSIISTSILESIGIKTTIIYNLKAFYQEYEENYYKYNIIIINNFYSNKELKKILNVCKKVNKNIKIIILTSEKNKTNHFINVLGFDGYLEYPFDQRKAISILTALIPKLKFYKNEPMYYINKNKTNK